MNKRSLRDSFASRFGFVMACIGSAVGVGNIWLFPRRVAAFGAPFLAAYLICVTVIGLSGVVGEMAFGRSMKSGTLGAFRAAAERAGMSRHLGTVIAQIPIFGSFALAVGYSVVCGWILKYTVGAISGSILYAGDLTGYIDNFVSISSGTNNLVFHLISLAIVFLILNSGISEGIEKVNKVLMPTFFLLFAILAVYVSGLDGAAEGYAYMFSCSDWGTLLSGEVWKYALGQAFFSLSLAGSGTLVYGSYLKGDENIPGCAALVALFDTLAAFIAALVIIPTIYCAGVDMTAEVTSGPGLMFFYLPMIFSQMTFGRVQAIIFFVAVLFAAVTSLINLFEGPIETLQSNFGGGRMQAVSLIVGSGGILAMLITNIVSEWMDVCSIYICPIGALLAAVMFFWVCGEDFAAAEIEKGGKAGRGKRYARLGKYVFCSLSLLVLILGSLTKGGIG